MIKTLIAISLAAYATATCDNACSGHGVCECGFCQCYDNWAMGYDLETGDCSDRVCPFEFAWVDAPNAAGKYHKYAECAGRGLCNRASGECECFEGYEGKACQRTSCPNDCSGHGTCEYIENLGIGSTPFSGTTAQVKYFVQDAFLADYKGWDRSKTRGCLCDPEYGDVDCSKRLCPYGNDMMDRYHVINQDEQFQTQSITFAHLTDITELNGNSFALTFRSKMNETFTTYPIVFSTVSATIEAHVKDALLRLPNRVIDKVDVDATTTATTLVLDVTFSGDYVEGTQHLLVVEDYKCGEGCTPMLTGLDTRTAVQDISETTEAHYNSYECGRRGKCDYETGLCQCFEGFTGPSCNACTALI
jgi:hypothetical protein